MGSAGPLCTRGVSIERQGANYAHMALQLMHCMSPCSSYLIWLRVVVQWYLECHLCYHINTIIRNGLWGPAVRKRTLYWDARRPLCTYGFTSNALPLVILILPDMTWTLYCHINRIMRTGLWGPVASQQVIWHLQNYMCIGVSLSLKGAFLSAQWAPEPQLSVLDLYDNIYEIQNVIQSLFTVKLDNVTIKTWNIWLVKLHVCTLPPDSQWSLLLCAAGPQSPVLPILLIWHCRW